MRSALRAGVVTIAATGIAVLGFAGVASAHVTVNPRDASQGGYARVAFRVPTESDTASTTKVEVFLPAEHPIASVSTMPVPGWTVKAETTHLSTPITTDDGDKIESAVTHLTWTANSADTAIKPGEFQEFPVSLGPLPEVDKLVFKALQTYSDGNVVRWIDESTPGSAEPAHPAPVLALAKAAAAGGAGAAPSAGTATVTTANTAGTQSSADGTSRGLAVLGLVLGLLGVALGGTALARSRRPAAPPAAPPAG